MKKAWSRTYTPPPSHSLMDQCIKSERIMHLQWVLVSLFVSALFNSLWSHMRWTSCSEKKKKNHTFWHNHKGVCTMVMLSASIQKCSTSLNAKLSVLVDAWHKIPLEAILKHCKITLHSGLWMHSDGLIQYSTVFLSVFFGKAVVFVPFYSIPGFFCNYETYNGKPNSGRV